MQAPPTDPPYDASWMKSQSTLRPTTEDKKRVEMQNAFFFFFGFVFGFSLPPSPYHTIKLIRRRACFQLDFDCCFVAFFEEDLSYVRAQAMVEHKPGDREGIARCQLQETVVRMPRADPLVLLGSVVNSVWEQTLHPSVRHVVHTNVLRRVRPRPRERRTLFPPTLKSPHIPNPLRVGDPYVRPSGVLLLRPLAPHPVQLVCVRDPLHSPPIGRERIFKGRDQRNLEGCVNDKLLL